MNVAGFGSDPFWLICLKVAQSSEQHDIGLSDRSPLPDHRISSDDTWL